MIEFVNAKINIGLNIIGKREDGYHLIETLFYPVGMHNGTPANPETFCDILELTERSEDDPSGYEENDVRFIFDGNTVGCPPEKNLVVKGVRAVFDYYGHSFSTKTGKLTMRLRKRLPDGAGMGGGSADAVFAMKMMARLARAVGEREIPEGDMLRLAAGIGADCPVFVANVPALGEGIGEKLTPVQSLLKGMWLVILKPLLHISTAEAFEGVTPRPSGGNPAELVKLPMSEWRDRIKNDFESTLFPKYPELKRLKESLYARGAEYASLTGSGAALYGIFMDEGAARNAIKAIEADYSAIILL